MALGLQYRRGGSSYSGLAQPIRDALTALEASLVSSLSETWRSAKRDWRYVTLRPSAPLVAQPYDFVLSLDGGTVLLSSPTPDTRLAEVMVVRATAEPIAVLVTDGLVNGASYHNPTAHRACLYVSTGEGWYSCLG
jgi:hypothetical protein